MAKLKKNGFVDGTLLSYASIVFTKLLGLFYIIPFTALIGEDGMVIYSDEELNKMTKKQLKAILESRGHFGFTGKHFEKGDPLGAMYHDSVETLREKVRKTQETF